ncbi:MAG: hypothetical protein ACHQ0I_03315 [Candidatus Lutacidiplasmatales archaeon]
MSIPTAGFACLISAAAVLPLPVSAVPNGAPGSRIQSLPGGVPGGTPCVGISYDKNNEDTANAVAVGGSNMALFLQRFTPPSGPFVPEEVCVAGFGAGIVGSVAKGAPGLDAATVPYDIVIYSDASGVPGSRLATVSAAPAPVISSPGIWMTTSVSGSVAPLSGPFWAGIRYASPGVYVGLDTLSNPSTMLTYSEDDGATYSPLHAFGDAYIRVVGGAPSTLEAVPTLSGAGLAALVGALAVGGFLVLRKA